MSPESRAKVIAAGRLESWAVVPLLLLIGSATWVGHYPSLALVYPIVKRETEVRSLITKISHHKERPRGSSGKLGA